tara:strand:+ start:136 stop:489 length:354 start_codon:yes stop_codon:yes gene_type:complete
MVVVVGLPYADVSDPILSEKMADLDKQKKAIGSKEYYRNMCMRSVNQSVGRAIRHQNDYASIVLIDTRFTADQSVLAGLPGWLGVDPLGAIKAASSFSFGEELKRLRDFYKARQQQF